MSCETFRWGDTVGIVCSSGRRTKAPKCWVSHCVRSSTRLCDWPMADGKTCSRPVCDGHGDHVGQDKDFCPPHSMENAKAGLKDGR